MFPNWNSSEFNDLQQYKAWADEAQDNSSYHSPAASPKSSSSSYDSCSGEMEALSLSDRKGKGVFSSLSKISGRLLKGSSSSGKHHLASEVSPAQLRECVKKAYKDLRYYHGTNLNSARSIQRNGMSARLKRAGATDTALSEAEQAPDAVKRASAYNYVATVHSAASSYALPASVENTRNWRPKAGDDGVPRLVRVFKTADFPVLEKDTDFPLSFAPFLNPLYRTASDIPAHAIRQSGRGSQRYSRQIVAALRDQMQTKYKLSASVEQVQECLSDVESDSDNDFPNRSSRR